MKKVAALALLAGAAAAQTWDDTSKASWTPTSEAKEDLGGGVTWIQAHGKTTMSGLSDAQQIINYFTMKASASSKLVTWAAMADNTKNKRLPLADMAADYEAHHPGWKVVAGINADQYFPTYGGGKGTDGSYWFVPQPYYPMIIDHQRRFPITPTPVTSNFAVFTNDGSAESIVQDPTFAGFAVYVYDENGGIAEVIPVNRINQAPSNSAETSVHFAYVSTSSSSTYVAQSFSGTCYVVGTADLAYMSNSRAYTDGVDSVFGVGKITSATSSGSVTKGQFAICSSHSSLKAGRLAVVQGYYAQDAVNSYESASGYHFIQRKSGVDQTTSSSYNTNRYNRSIFGRHADGTYFLMTADKGTIGGVSIPGLYYKEANAILKHYGAYDAYQDDGGGSTTAIIRTSDGTFKYVNTPSDGAPRSVLSGLFFVTQG